MASIPTPIILDTDIGTDVDDAFALAMAVKEPQIDLKAVTTVYGDVDLRARMARKLLDLLQRPDIPVAAGEGQPLYDGKDSYWGGWEGKRLLTPSDANLRYDPRPAVTLMRDLLLKSAEKITLVGIGPLTNFGILLRDHPEVFPQIKEIICMAGSLMPNDEEWNVQCDPQAALILLESGLPIKLGTRHYVRQPWITVKERSRLLQKGDAVVHILIDLMDEFLSHRTRTHTPMYDPVTLSTAFTEKFMPTESKLFALRMVNQVLFLDQLHQETENALNLQVPTDIYPQAFIQYLVSLLLNE